MRRFERYVALGDSSPEGLVDPDGRGGYRGWADRLAGRIAAAQGSLLYANLAVRGRHMRQVLDAQVPAALALAPDLVTVFAGTNDLISSRAAPAAIASDMEEMQRRLIASGATVLTITLPDLTPVLPLARLVAPRLHALNDALRAVAARTGARLVDVAAYPVASDPRLWDDDRLHANAAGHARVAAALAHALDLPGADESWKVPLPPRPETSARERLSAEISWWRRHLIPWAWRHLWGRSSGDGRGPKRPHLEPVRIDS